MVDLYVTMPTSELNSLLETAQISYSEIQEKGSGNIPDFKYENATAVVKWEGYNKNVFFINLFN